VDTTIELHTDLDYSRRQRFHALTTADGETIKQSKRLDDLILFCIANRVTVIRHAATQTTITLTVDNPQHNKEH